MPDLDAFEAEVRERIKQLASKDANTRRKAAEWLGESGDPSAITGLAHTYKHDADKGVREAAAYSLGMFRALQVGLAGKDKDRVMKLLQGVADGKMGGRVPVATRTLVRLEIGMVALAVILGVLGLILPSVINQPPVTPGAATSVPTQIAEVSDKDQATLLQEIRFTFTAVQNDAQNLQTQFQSVMQGGTLDCSGFYNNPTPYTLSPNNASQYPEIATLVNDLNAAVSSLATAKARFDQACDGVATLTPAEVGAPMGSIVTVIQALPGLQQALSNAEAAASATETPTATPEVLNTEGPTPSAVPTLDVRAYLGDLYGIVDDMTGPRGANTLLAQYWAEGQSGNTASCRDPMPTIPEDLDVPDGAPVDLARAILNINTGLDLVRDGWAAFKNACLSNTVPTGAVIGLQQTAAANEAFAGAQAALDRLR